MIIAMIAALALDTTPPATPAPTAAKTDPAAKSVAAAPSTPDPNKPICRRQTPVGSTIEQRVCKTQAQWDSEAAAAQGVMNGFKSPGTSR